MNNFNVYWNKFKNWVMLHKVASIAIASSLVVALVLAIVLPVTLAPKKSKVEKQQEMFHKDQNLLSPFANMTLWTDTSSPYSNNGVINLKKVSEDTGVKVFHLGFINPDQNKYLNSDGSIRWCWGGYYSMSENGNDHYQYEGIKKSIADFRNAGGEIVISFGGQTGVSPWTCTQNVDKLAQMYKEVIDLYSLARIDLDIETSNQDASHAVANAKAIKRVQDETGVEVSLTIPIMPYGWEDKQLKLIEAYLDAGVELVCINSMTMCYGGGTLPNEDYAWASVRALKNAKDQLAVMLRERGVNKTEKELYQMMGATVAIGFEADAYPTFTTDNMKVVAQFAKEVNLGLLSFWSINRDARLYANKGVTGTYEFLKVCKENY